MASGEEDGAVEEKETNNKKKRTKSAIATAWLTFYNIAMTAGWLVLALAMTRYYLQKGTHKGLYRSIARTLKFFQTFAVLEVGHCAIGIVRTSVIVTGVQVCSRIFMVWFVTNSIRQVQNQESVILFLVVWTITEITRYSFYTFNLLNHLPYFIKWASKHLVQPAGSNYRGPSDARVILVSNSEGTQLEPARQNVQGPLWKTHVQLLLFLRLSVLGMECLYNLFIVMYPFGVIGELMTIYAALPYVRRSGMYSLRLPNQYNVSFDYYYFLIIVMLSYIPLFPQLYFHMLRQRRRVLHGEVIVEKDE
ncbi:hypothetical protein NFI96_000353 [Prochilodus magdalenae]|nr:hypothetical protein NFI96_000353 [Prochilodus magdalenae]